MEISCLKCKKIFKIYPSQLKGKRKGWNGRRFCSQNCWNKFKTINTLKKCLYCHKDFFNRIHSKFCSRKCHNKSMLKYKNKICPICHKEFLVKPVILNKSRRIKFCSRQCYWLFHKGKNHSQWKGGVYEDERRTRDSSQEYYNWRRTVLIRDDFTCQKCGEKNIVLHIHHIKPYKEAPSLRINVNNGLSLCGDCHRDVHYKSKSFV